MNELVAEALRVLEVDRLVCAVHDRSLPAHPEEEDIGCGAAGSRGAEAFISFLAELGFTGIQLGPPGQISPGNLSPYDGTVFSRSTLNLAWQRLSDGACGANLIERRTPSQQGRPVRTGRCDYRRAFADQARLLDRLHDNWDALAAKGGVEARALSRRLMAFRVQAEPWLLRDSLYQVLSRWYGSAEAAFWSNPLDACLFSRVVPDDVRAARLRELQERFAQPLERYAREQMLLAEQHREFRRRAQAKGLVILGDLQVGLSLADRWAWAELMLDGYSMGAPPSRTNPDGQPWGYPVLNPELMGTPAEPGPGLRFHIRRFEKLCAEYDGVRLDHPHGLVCPWVYQNDTRDPYAVVREGTRLFSVGPTSRHASLAAFDIAGPDQLATGGGDPWSDDWVTALDDAQAARYASVFDTLMNAAAAAGVRREHILCEVLSTQPYPLGRVRERHQLGRFRVTAKADVTRDDDVYLPGNAKPEDWIMVGTHDTPPIWNTVRAWTDDQAKERAWHAAVRLAPDGIGRDALAAHFSTSRDALALAEFAVLFTSPARNVMVFVCDLLGEQAIYNRPGMVHPDNWTWRVNADFKPIFAERLARGAALDLPAVLALAVAALHREERLRRAPLIRALARAALAPLPSLDLRLCHALADSEQRTDWT